MQKDLAHLLASNTRPNPREITSIQSGIESRTKKISQLRLQLLEIEEEVRIHQAVLSPVRKMPLEIFGEIFSIAVQLPLGKEGRGQLLNLCLVCKAWRHAAVLTHGLWSSVSFSEQPMSAEKATDWLRRAGGAPKAFGFIMGEQDDCSSGIASPCRHTTTGLVKILTSGQSLDCLSLDCAGPQCLRSLLDSLRSDHALSESQTRPWNTIRSLSLKFRTFWNELPSPSDSLFLQIPSSVTSLDLGLPPIGMGLPDTMVSIPLHLPPGLLQRLTSFSMHCDWDGNQVSTALKYCQNVEKLTLGFDDFVHHSSITGFSPGDSEVVLPKLRTLCLLNISSHNLGAVFSTLATPVLETLDIHFSIDAEERLRSGHTQFAKKVHKFIRERSKCEDTFCTLSIRSAYTKTHELRKLVEGLPSIRVLTFAHIDFANDHNGPLHSYRLRGLPRLETLELLDISHSDSWLGSLVSFIRSRPQPRLSVQPNGECVLTESPDSLKKVVVTYRPKFSASPTEHGLEASDEVRMLRKEWGISVTIGPLLYHNA